MVDANQLLGGELVTGLWYNWLGLPWRLMLSLCIFGGTMWYPGVQREPAECKNVSAPKYNSCSKVTMASTLLSIFHVPGLLPTPLQIDKRIS